MSDLEQIWSLQQELNKSRSQMLTHRRRNIPKWLVRTGALEERGDEALQSEVVGQIIPVADMQRPLDDVIRAVANTPLTADAYNVDERILRDVFETTGVNEYLRGATPQIRRTATEASIIEGASNVKSAHKLSKIEDFTRQLATHILAIASELFPQTDYDEMGLFITGRDAEALNKIELGDRLNQIAQSPVATPDILQREAQATDLNANVELQLGPEVWRGIYQVEVVANSTELRNPIFKEQKYREMTVQLTQMAPILMQMGVQLNLKKLLELWFEAAGIQDIDAMFQPTVPQMGPQMPPQQQQSARQPGGGLQSMLPQMPNPDGMGAPMELLTPENTGALPPESA
jgi:hypothetical protein